MSYFKNNEEDLHFYERELIDARERLAPILGLDENGELPPVNGRTLEIMYDQLLKHVSFPFYGEFTRKVEQNMADVLYEISVDGLLDPDETPGLDQYGLVCLAREGIHPLKIPLAEVVIKQDDPNYNLVEDYCIWYWNHR